ncbi:MAG: FGGY-family carbohydrate kinase [Chloroflexota bacterium]
MPVTVGIDLSTTAAKAVVVRADGRRLAFASCPYPTDFLPGGRVEQDARQWWSATAAAVRAAVARSGAERRVAAICAATQGISIVPVDARGAPLRASINWLDARASEEAESLDRDWRGGRLPETTGRRTHPANSLPKIMWLRRHEPGVFSAARGWLTPGAYLARCMTGVPVSDHTLAAGTLAYSVPSLSWSGELLAMAGLAPDQMPELAWAGTTIGALTGEAAEALGIPAGIPVVLGGQDQKCAAWYAGLAPGAITVSLGTASAISGLVGQMPADPEFPVPVSPYLFPGSFVLEAVTPAAGASIEWLARILSAGSGKTFRAADAARIAGQAPPGANGVRFSPHLAGTGTPDWDAAATGGFTGIRLGTSAADLARAVLEGVADDIAGNVALLRDLGVAVDGIHCFGGGARSGLWISLIEAACRRTVSVSVEPETAALGAAQLALGAVTGAVTGR